MEAFNPWLKDWSFYASDVIGFLRGSSLLGGGRGAILNLAVFGLCGWHYSDVEDATLGGFFRIVNIYSPYVNKKPFWESLSDWYFIDTKYNHRQGP